MKRCLGCMEEYDGQVEVCPKCGYVEKTEPDLPIHMAPGQQLIHGESAYYTIGRTLGYGGFGVTYLAWDHKLNQKVAIKEYLPSEFSTRGYGETVVTIFDGDKKLQYNSGLEKFVDEAKRLAKFSDQPGVVRIYDAFRENETAYIVMEYLDGMTLKEYMEENGTFESQMAIELLLPVIEALRVIHEEGIIHRDIAPDNIMITRDGQVKLIDFGAARYATTSRSRSLSVIIKPGYSPEEQYRSRGDQGSWTDVYAIGATLYKMITGKTPPEALERRAFFEKKGKDILEPLSKYAKDIPRDTENAILNALNVRIEDRTPDMGVLEEELTTDKAVKRRYGKIKIIDVLKWPLWMKIAVSAAVIALSTLGILFGKGIIGFKNKINNDIVIPQGMTRVPAVVNQNLTDAEILINEAQLTYTISGKEYSGYVPKDYVLVQDLQPGYLTSVNMLMSLAVSGGPELASVPNVESMEMDEACRILEESGFDVDVRGECSNVLPEGYIIRQDIEAGESVPIGTKIGLVVSLGRDESIPIEERTITVPDFVGMTYEEALKYAVKNELTISVSQRTYTDKYPENVVMSQDVEAGTEISNMTPIALEVSLGVRYVTVPDVVYFTEAEAKEKLEKNELTYKIAYQESETVSAGCVISQSISDGSKVLPQTEVALIISSGKGSFDMPMVAGLTESEAVSLLQSQGLRVTCNYENNDSVKSGNVISQEPAQGTQVKGGGEVRLLVSAGEKLYTVPNVTGLSRDEAMSKLAAEKFKVSVNEVYHDTVAGGMVVSQALPAGGQYRKNTEIVIEVSRGKQPFTLSFDANGGSVSEGSRTVYFGDGFGSLPSASRDGYKFEGWYTSAQGGSAVGGGSTLSQRGDQTVYAHWRQKDRSDGWVASLPGGVSADQYDIQTKTEYRYCDLQTTSSSDASLKDQGWTLLSTDTNYGDWGEVRYSDTAVSESETRQVLASVKEYRYQNYVYGDEQWGTSTTLSGYEATGTSEVRWGTEYESRDGTKNETRRVNSSYDVAPVTHTTPIQYQYDCYYKVEGTSTSGPDRSAGSLHDVQIRDTPQKYDMVTLSGGATVRGYKLGLGKYYFNETVIGGETVVDVAGYTVYRVQDGTKYYQFKRWVASGGVSDWTSTYTADTNEKRCVDTRTRYPYKERAITSYTYHYERWGDWSAWSESAASESSSRKVEQRTLYYYVEK